MDPLEDLSRTDYTNIEHHFLNPIKRGPPTAHNSPTTYENCMKKTKNTQLNRMLDKSTEKKNKLHVLIMQPRKTMHSKCYQKKNPK